MSDGSSTGAGRGDGRDELIARALGSIPVPDYEDDFWGRLDSRLTADGLASHLTPPMAADVEAADVEAAALDADDLVDTLRPGERRRGVLVLAAAAAVVLVVVAVSLRRDGSNDVTTASERTTALANTSTSTPPGGTVVRRTPGVSNGPVQVGRSGSLDTPQDAFATWADAIHVGKTDAAMAVTGPLTVAYGAALQVSADDQVKGWGEVWGSWAEPAGRQIDIVELGDTAGHRVVAVVLQHPSTLADRTHRYDALPLVQYDDGWKVEPAAFPTSSDGRIEMVSPAPGARGLDDLPAGVPVKVHSTLTGSYVVSLDLTIGARLQADQTEPDHTVLWRPPAMLKTGEHLLLVAHVAEDTVSVQALPVTVRAADRAQP
jgi:hypothetical protein